MKFCKKPFEHMYVMPDGRVRLCGWISGAIGNLIEEDLMDIWHGEKAELQREAFRNGSFRFCRETSCPFLENDSLPDLDEEEFKAASIAKDIPTDYDIACDYICNHSCPSCRESVFKCDEEYTKNVNIMIDKLIPFANKADAIAVDGCGDAFASPNIMRLMQCIHPENKNCVLIIETNGVLCDEEHMKKIEHYADHELHVIVTPNSFDRATFKYLNGGHDTYDKVINNLYYLKELRQKGIVNRYEISIVVQDRNFMELPEFADRCINDFGVDRVIVKPLYHWFMMPEDLYWHKDVLNPMHPYHKEYIEMLKDPRLQHEKVFFWGGANLHESRPHPAYKYRDSLKMIERCIEDDRIKEKVAKYFNDKGISKMYIYGDENMAPFINSLIKDAVEVKGFMARDFCRDELCGQKVMSIWDYKPEPDDSIVVLNYAYYDFVRKDMELLGFEGPLLRMNEMIDEILKVEL